MRTTSILLGEIFLYAKGRGLTDKDLAQLAGFKPTNLARIKKTGKCNSGTLEALLGALNCELHLTVREQEGPRTLEFVTKKLNAGRLHKLTLEELRRFLTKFRRGKDAERAYSHLIGLVEEVPLEQIHDLVRQNDATLSSLQRIADYVNGEGETVNWIHDQVAA